MNGLMFLSSEDFSIEKGTRGNILCHSIYGYSLILFYSNSCTHCANLIPIFKQLPGTINGCQFGMINIGINRTCLEMSKNTIAPITYVPYIVLYVDGRPFMAYKGPYDINEIKRFIIEVANNLQRKRQFNIHTEQKQKSVQQKHKIPGFTIGIPVYGDGNDDVCYLQYNAAYNK